MTNTSENTHRQSVEAEGGQSESSALLSLAMNKQREGRFVEAWALYERVIASPINQAEETNALANLAMILMDHGRYMSAITMARRAAVLGPQNSSLLLNLGNFLMRSGQHLAAGKVLQHLDPNNAHALHNRALVAANLGRYDQAIKFFVKAIQLIKDAGAEPSADLYNDLAYTYLRNRQWKLGFKYLEYRWQVLPKGPAWHMDIPQWDGSPLEGRTILIHHEQGAGDTIQFIRFLKLLRAQQDCHVLFLCPVALCPLIHRSGLAHEVIPDNFIFEPIKADVHLPLMSLMQYVLDLRKVPTKLNVPIAPYLKVNESLLLELPIPVGGRKKVGICWAGNPAHEQDRWRSMPAAMMLQLASNPMVQLYALQEMEEHRQELAAVGGGGLAIDLGPMMQGQSWEVTAKLISQLDLVVSVDTAILHLAGAIGKPTIALHAWRPCWRWLADRTGSPWYTHQIAVRQSEPGKWQPVIDKASDLLLA